MEVPSTTRCTTRRTGRIRSGDTGSELPQPRTSWSSSRTTSASSFDIHRTRSGAYVVISATSRTTRQEWVLDAADAYARPLPVRARVAGVEDAVEHQDGPGGGRWLLLSNEVVAVSSAQRSGGRRRPGCREAARSPAATAAGSRLHECDAFSGWCRPSARRRRRAADRGLARCAASDRRRDPGRRLPGEGAGTLPAPRTTSPSYAAAGLLVEEPRSSTAGSSAWLPFSAGRRAPVVRRTAAPGHDPRAYLVEDARTVVARDRVPIPITLARAAGAPLDGTAACLVWAYGAYESCDWPVFDPVLPAEWLDRGVVYVQAHVRGGGRAVRASSRPGRPAAKSTTFTDLVDVSGRPGRRRGRRR